MDFFLIEQLRTVYKMPILSCKRLVRFWILSTEDYIEPKEAFKKVSCYKVLFEDYFLKYSTSAQIGSSERWEVRSLI